MNDRRISQAGLSVAPPSGWEASIVTRPPAAGHQTYPVVQAATVPLTAGRGDFGGGVVETLGPGDLFLSAVEFGPDAAGTALFRELPAVPRFTPQAFDPNRLQRAIAGQAGAQRFFTVAGRAFCLYVVLGAFLNRVDLSARANDVISTLRIESR